MKKSQLFYLLINFENIKKFSSHGIKCKLSIPVLSFISRIFYFSYKWGKITCAPHTLRLKNENVPTLLFVDQFWKYKKFSSHGIKCKLSIPVLSFISRIFYFSYKWGKITCAPHTLRLKNENVLTLLFVDQFWKYKKFSSHGIKCKLSIPFLSFISRILYFSYKWGKITCALHTLMA